MAFGQVVVWRVVPLYDLCKEEEEEEEEDGMEKDEMEDRMEEDEMEAVIYIFCQLTEVMNKGV